VVNKNHFALLYKGVASWNQWRNENKRVIPNFVDAHLIGAHLAGASLRFSNFDNADLRHSNLTRTDLAWATFKGANLRIAVLSEACLFEACLTNANLIETDLTKSNLRRANLQGADLSHSVLTEVDLKSADLTKANLEGVNFSNANLADADLSEANLTDADLTNANLTNANMSKATLIGTRFTGATLTNCRVFGINAWGLIGLENAEQSNLIVTPCNETAVSVDNLEMAQFVYLMLHNEKIRTVINTIGEKGVLILGRFTERKHVLEAIRYLLREIGYLPIVFDFEKPTDRDLDETVRTLAGLSRFIIADITKPKSVPLELEATVPDYMIPMVTIIEKGEKPFSMFKGLWTKYRNWVLEPLAYDSIEQLQSVFLKAVIEPANDRLLYIRKRKAEEMPIRDAVDYEPKEKNRLKSQA
jgi:uncharacterized protein YjbI with pentapeptide repeats